jgi:hypothetical protein
MLRNANGDLIPAGTAQAFYCRECLRYIGPTGERVLHASKDVIVWVEACAWCVRTRLERDAKAEARRIREEELSQPRVCALDGCAEAFLPRTLWQRFCCPEHRWLNGRGR